MDIKKLGILSGVALVLVFGGYAAGRYSAPEKVTVIEKVKEVKVTEVVKVVETEKVLAAIQNISQQKNVHKVKVTERRPDGSVVTREETSDKTKTDTQTKTNETDKTKSSETKKEVQIVEREITKVVERARPKWSLSLQPGFDVAGALGAGNPYTILPSDNYLLRHMVIGASLERRLIGPLSTGVWANTQGAGGITLRLEF